jgi:hypothetical protein
VERRWIWASAAIAAMWAAVILVGLFGPTFEAESASGDRVEIPLAAILVALGAIVGTIIVAWRGFRPDPD